MIEKLSSISSNPRQGKLGLDVTVDQRGRLIVSALHTEGLAARSGQIQLGDVVVAVNLPPAQPPMNSDTGGLGCSPTGNQVGSNSGNNLKVEDLERRVVIPRDYQTEHSEAETTEIQPYNPVLRLMKTSASHTTGEIGEGVEIVLIRQGEDDALVVTLGAKEPGTKFADGKIRLRPSQAKDLECPESDSGGATQNGSWTMWGGPDDEPSQEDEALLQYMGEPVGRTANSAWRLNLILTGISVRAQSHIEDLCHLLLSIVAFKSWYLQVVVVGCIIVSVLTEFCPKTITF